MDNMYILAAQEHLAVHESDCLGVDGIYLVESGIPPIIGLNRRIMSNIPYARCVFAEELGHHFTTVGTHIPKEFYCYAERITVNKVEYKAHKWAAYYLIPENDLLNALRDNIYEIWELAEHFCVTEAMVQLRLKLFRGDNDGCCNIS